MKKAQAEKIVSELRAVCKKHGLWLSVLREEKPHLKMIRIQEISIKVEED